jgi:16S rRNA (cytosine967-C5)-methyltransferase
MNQSTPQREPAGLAARDAAASLLAGVLDRRQPLDALLGSDRAFGALPERDRRLARAIASTALRRHGTIRTLFDRLITRKPPRSRDFFHILEIAAAQILFMQVADHAAVSLAIDRIAADPKARHLKGLANAVLRRLAREREALLASLDASVDTPDWLWARWVAAYGQETAGAIAAAHRAEPPLDLSVKDDAAGWAEKLGGAVTATGSVRLADAGAVEQLAGYDDGAWWVQDMAAALPARLLGDVAGKRIADLCAAPGGKTAQLAAAGAEVTAVDISANRLKRLSANLARLHLAAETVAADILDWQPPAPFDAVLLDAPCSATGTIRRHPDVAWLKAPEDIAALAEVQARLIDRAAAMLRPGGTLVYCTCSLEPEEGEAQLPGAMQRNDLMLKPVAAAEIGGLAAALAPAGTLRTLPSHDAGRGVPSGMDGFFVMRLAKGVTP